jgi:hypothetical protein
MWIVPARTQAWNPRTPAGALARPVSAFGGADGKFGNMGLLDALFRNGLQRRRPAVVNGCGQAPLAKTVPLVEADTSNP